MLERFFDESGGMQLVLHAPFGSRINRAWGLALRKRFCRQFDFELQAAATEDAVLLSLGPQHSFPLADVFRYLHPSTAKDVLVQAFLDAPVFKTRWRWNTTISLAVPRNRNGKKVAPQLQRMMADDLMAAVFPDAAACFENIPGDREIPDHPLVNQAVRDCLEEAMDFDGLARVLTRIHRGRDPPRRARHAGAVAADVRDPQRASRTRSSTTRRSKSAARRPCYTRRGGEISEFGALDAAAIARVRDEERPDPRDADELHDALLTAGFLLDDEVDRSLAEMLVASRRAALCHPEPRRRRRTPSDSTSTLNQEVLRRLRGSDAPGLGSPRSVCRSCSRFTTSTHHRRSRVAIETLDPRRRHRRAPPRTHLHPRTHHRARARIVAEHRRARGRRGAAEARVRGRRAARTLQRAESNGAIDDSSRASTATPSIACARRSSPSARRTSCASSSRGSTSRRRRSSRHRRIAGGDRAARRLRDRRRRVGALGAAVAHRCVRVVAARHALPRRRSRLGAALGRGRRASSARRRSRCSCASTPMRGNRCAANRRSSLSDRAQSVLDTLRTRGACFSRDLGSTAKPSASWSPRD